MISFLKVEGMMDFSLFVHSSHKPCMNIIQQIITYLLKIIHYHLWHCFR